MIYIIGGGSAGLFAAAHLAKHRKVTVLEEHDPIGRPIQCTGLLSEAVHELYNVPKGVIADTLRRARIMAPNGQAVNVNFRRPNLLVWRDLFDQSIENMAAKAGAKILKGHKFLGLDKTGIQVQTPAKTTMTLDCEYLIGADGPTSAVAKAAGLSQPHKEDLLGMQVTKKVGQLDAIEFYPHVGEYAWAVPEPNQRARIGIALRSRERAPFDKLLNMYPGEVLDRQAGIIPLHNPKQRVHTQFGSMPISLVGDAAGHIKNTTGGGILPGMKAATILVHTILHGGNYERSVRRAIGKELWVHYTAHKIFRKFSENDWNLLVGYFQQKRLCDVLATESRDHMSAMLIKLALREPRLLRFALRI